MLEWTIRWGVPLALVASYFALVDPRAATPSSVANHALETVRDTLLGLIPKFF